MPGTEADLLLDGPSNAETTFLFAHGAGAGMDTAFMRFFADGLAARQIRCVRFEFPYMQRRRSDGKRRPPDRMPVLLDRFRDVLGAVRSQGPGTVVIGGKSMGGRVASLLADEAGVDGLICLGYPFHPPGQPTRLRTEHLLALRTRALIVQGTRDPFGTLEEVEAFSLSPSIEIAWIEGGNHDFTASRASGRTTRDNLASALDRVARFAEGCARRQK